MKNSGGSCEGVGGRRATMGDVDSGKFYKDSVCCNFEMFPGDSFELPDDFFINLIERGQGLNIFDD